MNHYSIDSDAKLTNNAMSAFGILYKTSKDRSSSMVSLYCQLVLLFTYLCIKYFAGFILSLTA